MARAYTVSVAITAILGAACCGRDGELPRLAPPRAGERVLIVAPHVDDESIAAAGYIGDAIAAGADVFLVYLTAGDGGRGAAEIEGRTLRPRGRDFRNEGRVRLGEAVAGSGVLGVPRRNVFFLGYPDGDLDSMLRHPDHVVTSRATGERAVPYAVALSPGAPYRLANLEADLDRVFAVASPTRVFAPVQFDGHPDHRASGELVRRLLARGFGPPQLLGYLVHARGFPAPLRRAPRRPLVPPAQFAARPWLSYTLSASAEARKSAALRVYKSQREEPYLRLLLDAFVRANELFVAEPARVVGPAAVSPLDRVLVPAWAGGESGGPAAILKASDQVSGSP